MTMETLKLKVWDLCLFTKCSLANACRSYKIPEELWKTSFNHKKVHNIEDAIEHEEEATKYCEQDVKALEGVYKAFATKMWDLFKINVINCITLSQYAYEYWRTTLTDEKIVLPEMKDYDFIRRGLFGGRCGPQYSHFVSDEYASLMREYNTHGNILPEHINNLNDALRMFDVVSLYPSQMKLGTYPLGTYAYLTPDDCNRLKDILNNASHTCTWIGFAEVDVQCPDDLISPFLMARTQNGSVEQSLTNKTCQVYPSTELIEAMRLGYKITAIHKAIQFEKQGNPFVNFIDKIFALKQAAAVEPKDPVQYEIAKVCRIVGVMAASVFWVHWARVRFLYNPINFFISAYDEFALWQNVSKGCGRRVENSNE